MSGGRPPRNTFLEYVSLEGDGVRMSLPSSCKMNLLSRSLAESGELDPERPAESQQLREASLPTDGAQPAKINSTPCIKSCYQ